jgi:hypothetical protein
MGVNQNISILMLFDCMRVNTGLGSHWICNSEKGGYMWIDGFSKNISILILLTLGIVKELIHDKN